MKKFTIIIGLLASLAKIVILISLLAVLMYLLNKEQRQYEIHKTW